MIFVRFLALHVQQLHHVFAVRSPLKRLRNQTGCANVIPSPATIFRLPSGQSFAPTPRISAYVLNVVSCSFRFLAHSLTNVRSLGCGERCHLSHAVGDSAVVLSGMSRQIALQTRSEALRRTRRGLNARQGMEGAKTLTERFRRSGAPIPARGFQVARNRASPLQSPFARYKQPLVGRWS